MPCRTLPRLTMPYSTLTCCTAPNLAAPALPHITLLIPTAPDHFGPYLPCQYAPDSSAPFRAAPCHTLPYPTSPALLRHTPLCPTLLCSSAPALPCRTAPHSTAPNLTSPCLAVTYLAEPHLPYRSPRHRARLNHTLRHRTSHCQACRNLPVPAIPNHTSLDRTLPAGPYPSAPHSASLDHITQHLAKPATRYHAEQSQTIQHRTLLYLTELCRAPPAALNPA
jgi:hypothetical protein